MLNTVYEILVGIAAFIPALAANPGAVLTGGKGRMDLGKNFIDGKRIFGDGKTVSGYLGGILVGAFFGFMVYVPLSYFSLFPDDPGYIYLLFACHILSWGSLTGDLLGSFTKRRMGIEKGQKVHDKNCIGEPQHGINGRNWRVHGHREGAEGEYH